MKCLSLGIKFFFVNLLMLFELVICIGGVCLDDYCVVNDLNVVVYFGFVFFDMEYRVIIVLG